MAIADQYLATPPPCVVLSGLEWDGLVVSEPNRSAKSDFVFLCRKPLYGSRCAPLRWYLTISGILQKAGYRCHRTDLCVFSRRKANLITSLVVLHVDDFLICVTQEEHDYFCKTISVLKSGPIVQLEVGATLVFCGLSIVFNANHSYGLSQDSYRSRLVPIDSGFAADVPIAPLRMDSLSRLCRAFVGGALWMLQTRYDISFLTIKLATLISQVCTDVESRREFVRISHLIVQTVMQTDVTVWYHRPPPKCDRRRFQIITFADAGFHSLPNLASIESFCVGWGLPLFRDGIIHCHLHLIYWNSRKLRRVARSSMSCEVAALCTALDCTLWIRSVYHEIFFGQFAHEVVSPEDSAPLISPFALAEKSEIIQFALGSQRRKSLLGVPQDKETAWFLSIPTSEAPSSMYWMSVEKMRKSYQSFFTYSGLITGARAHCLLLTDSPNAFAASHETNSRALERTTRLNLHYLRDHLSLISFSFVSAGFNLADTGTKQHSTSWLRFECCKTNRCRIGFLSRKDLKSLVHLVHSYESSRCGSVS